MNAILFLDFDGVLRPFGPIEMEGGLRIVVNPQLFPWLPILAKLLNGRFVSIVVSSDWARICDDDALKRLLGPLGARVVDVLPGNPSDDRARRIKQYVSRSNLQTWLALDDDPSVRIAAKTNKHFVWCPGDRGISDARVQAAVRKWLRPLCRTIEVGQPPSMLASETTPPAMDIIGARAKPGVYVGRVTIVNQKLGLARLKPNTAGFSILVPLWKFPIAERLGARVEFTVGNGGVIAMRLRNGV